MLHRLTRWLGAILLLGPLLAAPAAYAATDGQSVIDGARKVLADLRHNPEFGNAEQIMHQAKAVLIVPSLIKGGFIIGGSGGEGVLMVHARNGTWSNPAFYAIGSGSVGLQAGLEKSELVLMVMTDRGLEGLLHDHFKLGAQAGISVIALGSNVEGALAGPTPPDVVAWSNGVGLYGGLTLDGSLIKPLPHEDAAYYGRPLTTHEILFGQFTNPRTAGLRRQIEAIG